MDNRVAYDLAKITGEPRYLPPPDPRYDSIKPGESGDPWGIALALAVSAALLWFGAVIGWACARAVP